MLNSAELRVLGSLMEKESTTPEYYPLTLNSLMAACNQKTNRWPVTALDEADIAEAIQGLRNRRFAAEISGAGMRVPKYAQRFTETLNMGRREAAVLCVLMLRGPETTGELKARTERMHAFADLEEIETVLQKLVATGMVVRMGRQPGQKEARFMHLLGGQVTAEQFSSIPQPEMANSTADRLGLLEAEVSRLREEVGDLRRRLEAVL